MVLQKAVNHLRNRPKEERRATALGIALLIVAILFIGWTIMFFKRIQSSSIRTESIGTSVNRAFDLSAARESQRQLLNVYDNSANPASQNAEAGLSSQNGY
ncbi:MAG: hypothetical protein NUV88_01920 [Candidatus Kaiserbacteria bacterium]|nr:hypothetical protein [Candidatus Kaiserbacteria bacterium]